MAAERRLISITAGGGSGGPSRTRRRNSGTSSSLPGAPWASSSPPQRVSRSAMARPSPFLPRRRDFAHTADHRLHVLDRRPGQDAVPEVEDVPGASARLLKDRLHSTPHLRRRREEGDRGKVALDGGPGPHFLPGGGPRKGR